MQQLDDLDIIWLHHIALQCILFIHQCIWCVFCVLIFTCTIIRLVKCIASSQFIWLYAHKSMKLPSHHYRCIFTSAPAPNKLSTTPWWPFWLASKFVHVLNSECSIQTSAWTSHVAHGPGSVGPLIWYDLLALDSTLVPSNNPSIKP